MITPYALLSCLSATQPKLKIDISVNVKPDLNPYTDVKVASGGPVPLGTTERRPRDHLARENAVKIGELAAKTGVAPRLLRYYEEVGILTPWRAPNGYRSYGEPAIDRVLQIRELLEAGLTTDMIREVLPCLDAQKDERESLTCPDIDVTELDGLRRHLTAIKRRIDVLQRNERAIEAYLKVRAENTTAPPAAADEVVALVARP